MTDGLTFNTLRGGNKNRLPKFKNAKGKRAHTKKDDWSLNDWMTAVCGEVGELANMLKKVRRGDYTLKENRKEIADEIADVVIYLDILADKTGIDLGEAVISKFNEKSREQNLPVFIDHEDWHMFDPRPYDARKK